jgi:hypothetical protein
VFGTIIAALFPDPAIQVAELAVRTAHSPDGPARSPSLMHANLAKLSKLGNLAPKKNVGGIVSTTHILECCDHGGSARITPNSPAGRSGITRAHPPSVA